MRWLPKSPEDYFFRNALADAGDGHTNAMSALTAGNCCLAGLAPAPSGGDSGMAGTQDGWRSTALIAFFNLWILFCYLERGQRTLQAVLDIEVALTTAVAWLFLGVGLVAAGGPRHFLVWPLVGSSTRALLLRRFLPAKPFVVHVSGVLHSSLIAYLVGDLALLSTLWTLLASVIVTLLILHAAHRIGGRIDRAERDRQQALEEMCRAKEVAEQHNRTKSRFLANMSHEFATPLTVIIGYVELLREEAQEGQDELLPDLEEVHAQSKHLLAVINDLLDFSKIEADKIELHLETFDLAQMLGDTAAVIDRCWTRERQHAGNQGAARPGDHARRPDKAASVLAQLARQCLQVHRPGADPPGRPSRNGRR